MMNSQSTFKLYNLFSDDDYARRRRKNRMRFLETNNDDYTYEDEESVTNPSKVIDKK